MSGTKSCVGRLLAALPVSITDGNLVVPADVNSEPAELILDTGTERTTVAPWAAKAYELAEDQSQPIVTYGISGVVTAPSARISQLSFGQTTTGPFLAAIAPLPIPLSSSDRIIGVIGMDILSHYAIKYDLLHDAVELFEPVSCSFPPYINSFTAIPIEYSRSGIIILKIILNHVAVPTIFDTGATISAINLLAASAAGITSSGQQPSTQATGFGGTPIPIFYYSSSDLSIGDETLYSQRLAVGDFHLPYSQDDRQMLLGLDFLRTHIVIVIPGSSVLYTRAEIASASLSGSSYHVLRNEDSEPVQIQKPDKLAARRHRAPNPKDQHRKKVTHVVPPQKQ